MSVKRPEAKEVPGKGFQNIGWWTDNKGYKHHGVIPSKEDRDGRSRISANDSWLYKALI